MTAAILDFVFPNVVREGAAMAILHVMPDELGRWRVFENMTAAPLSEHCSATDAELAAWRHARAFGADGILVHDRYGRTHERCGRVADPTPAREQEAQ